MLFASLVLAVGRLYSLTSDRFHESEFDRPLSGDEFEEMAVASQPKLACTKRREVVAFITIHPCYRFDVRT